MKALFSLLLFASLRIESVSAEVRTYRIVDTGRAGLRYGGGLLDFNLTAALKGTIEVTVAEDNSASVTSFDLTLHDLVNTGTYDVGWEEGDSLADLVNFDPDLLAGEKTQEAGLDRLLMLSTEPSLTDSALVTYLSIQHSNATSATLVLTSSRLYVTASPGPMRPVLDTPSMSIGTSAGGGLPVQLVPEPSGLILTAASAVMFLKRR